MLPWFTEKFGNPHSVTHAYGREAEEAVERGIFGAPIMIVDGELYFGKDRLDFVESALS